MEGDKMAHPHACCDGMWGAMRKKIGTGKGKEEWEKDRKKEEGKKEMGDDTVAPAESCANSETSPLPSPSSCQVVPQPLGRAQLSKKRGRGGGMVVVFISRKKNSPKIACPKMARVSPCHGL